MSNPLFNAMQGMSGNLPGQMGQFQRMAQEFKRFKAGFNGDPQQEVQVPSTAPNRKSRGHKGFWIFSFAVYFIQCKLLLISYIVVPFPCELLQNHFTRNFTRAF